MDVKGQAAIITGGASGLGAATAEVLSAAGAKVALLDLNVEAAEALAKKLGGIAVKCDVTDEASAKAALAKVAATYGVGRVLVNCAGIGPPKRIVGRDGPMPLAEFKQVIEINLIGTFNMMRLFAAETSKAEPLADGERGVIVSTASVAAFEGQIGQAAYSSSKGGVVALTMPAAREFAQFGIRVMTIAPGIFHTPMLAALPQDAQDSLGASVPFPRRLGTPREFAELVAFIVRCNYLNGEVDPPRRRAAHGPALDFGNSIDAEQFPERADRMGRLRPRRHHFLSALFRDVRSLHHHADLGGVGNEQGADVQDLRFRRLSAGADAGALHHPDAVRRRHRHPIPSSPRSGARASRSSITS